MVQIGSYLRVVDNSGAKLAYCIRIISQYKSKSAKIGDTILITIKSVRKNRTDTNKIAKGKIYKAVVIRAKIRHKKITGNTHKFLENSVVLLTKQNKMLATRVLGLITKDFRYTKFTRLLILSAGVVV